LTRLARLVRFIIQFYADRGEGFGYEFNTLYNPDDSFAKAYEIVSSQTDPSVPFNIAAAFFPFLLKLPFPRVLEISAARQLILRQATKLVRDKEAKSTTGKDILSLLIAENDKCQGEGRLVEMELIDQCMTFLAAGHETVSSGVLMPFCLFLTIADVGSTPSCTTSRYTRSSTACSSRFT